MRRRRRSGNNSGASQKRYLLLTACKKEMQSIVLCMNISWHCRVECTAYLLRTAAPTILIIVLSTNCLNRQWRWWRTTPPMVERDITAISVIVLLYHQHHPACMRKEGG